MISEYQKQVAIRMVVSAASHLREKAVLVDNEIIVSGDGREIVAFTEPDKRRYGVGYVSDGAGNMAVNKDELVAALETAGFKVSCVDGLPPTEEERWPGLCRFTTLTFTSKEHALKVAEHIKAQATKMDHEFWPHQVRISADSHLDTEFDLPQPPEE